MPEFTEFPKMLYKGKQHHIVHTEAEESAKTEEGWSATPAPADAPAPEQAKESVSCAKCAEMEAKVADLTGNLSFAHQTIEDLRAQLTESLKPTTGSTGQPSVPPPAAPTNRGRPVKA